MADAVALVVKGGERQPDINGINDKKQLTHLLNLLLKQLSGIPLLETVVNGTRQSGIEGNILTVPVLWFV